MKKLNIKSKALKIMIAALLFLPIAVIIIYPIRLHTAQQKANDFIQKSPYWETPYTAKEREFFNRPQKKVNSDDVELVRDWTGWNFHIYTKYDPFGGCGSTYNYYHIDWITFKITDRSYVDNGPC